MKFRINRVNIKIDICISDYRPYRRHNSCITKYLADVNIKIAEMGSKRPVRVYAISGRYLFGKKKKKKTKMCHHIVKIPNGKC